ncbi:MAG: hypothetical protein IPK22_11130 [Verrucomicrobiaceae bacterium]|nr:hypothetical protein [Verrucomicrobiaceae bacterium]
MQITEHAISAEDISGLRSLIQEADLFGSNQAAHAAHRLRICIEVGGKLESWKAAILAANGKRGATRCFQTSTK